MKRVAAIVASFVFVILSSASVLRAAVLLVGDGTPSSCTLVALQTAIAAASNGGPNNIRFRCGAAPITIAILVDDAPAFTIPTQTTIDGEGLVSLDLRGSASPFVIVSANTSVVFENLTIRNGGTSPAIFVDGTLTVRHSTLSDNFAGAFLNRGTLIVRDSTISGSGRLSNTAIENSGALTIHKSSFFENHQGAIVNSGTVEVVNCVFSRNDSISGTIVNSAGSLTVKNSVFSYNFSEQVGGAIYNAAKLDVSDSTFFANSAFFEGGAIAGGGFTLRNSQLIDNQGGFFGGGVSSSGDVLIDRTFLVGNSAPAGGGIVQSGTLTITNSFILANKATDTGGGIYVKAGSPAPVLKRTTVTNNTPNDIAIQP